MTNEGQPRKRKDLFDEWATSYDPSSQSGQEFPFEGYDSVLDTIVTLSDPRPGMDVLDIGIGTGNLAKLFFDRGCIIWGTDFSPKMLEAAREKLPGARLIQADLRTQWPLETDQRFDRIVSAYVFHEFDLPTKLRLLERLIRDHLDGKGRVVIGDIAFETARAREAAWERSQDDWDDEEHYWAADETGQALKEVGFVMRFEKISSCGGIFVVGDGTDKL